MSEQRMQLMRDRLTSALKPSILDVIDDSAKHHGHAGSQGGAGHYQVRIASASFADKKLLECHRLVYSALGDMMEKEIHALRIQIVNS